MVDTVDEGVYWHEFELYRPNLCGHRLTSKRGCASWVEGKSMGAATAKTLPDTNLVHLVLRPARADSEVLRGPTRPQVDAQEAREDLIDAPAIPSVKMK